MFIYTFALALYNLKLNTQWPFVVSLQVSQRAVSLSSVWPEALALTLSDLHSLVWWRELHSFHSLSFLLVWSRCLAWRLPVLLSCQLWHQFSSSGLRCFSHLVESCRWRGAQLSNTTMAACLAGLAVGVTWVHYLWEPCSLLFMDSLIRDSKQNPTAQRPRSVPGTATSQTVKVICLTVSQRFTLALRSPELITVY